MDKCGYILYRYVGSGEQRYGTSVVHAEGMFTIPEIQTLSSNGADNLTSGCLQHYHDDKLAVDDNGSSVEDRSASEKEYSINIDYNVIVGAFRANIAGKGVHFFIGSRPTNEIAVNRYEFIISQITYLTRRIADISNSTADISNRIDYISNSIAYVSIQTAYVSAQTADVSNPIAYVSVQDAYVSILIADVNNAIAYVSSRDADVSILHRNNGKRLFFNKIIMYNYFKIVRDAKNKW
jgi:hypothetical protein